MVDLPASRAGPKTSALDDTTGVWRQGTAMDGLIPHTAGMRGVYLKPPALVNEKMVGCFGFLGCNRVTCRSSCRPKTVADLPALSSTASTVGK